MLVRIDRSTIKNNPDAGKTFTMVEGVTQISFKIKGKLPEFLRDERLCVILAEKEGEYYSGELYNEKIIDLVLQVPGASVQVNRNLQRIEHLPSPRYLYKYENPTITCEECNNLIHVHDIDTDYNEDGNEFTTCPNCKSINSFEDIYFENINDALKEIGEPV